MWFKSKDKFLLVGILYVLLVLVGLFILARTWLPPGYTLVGHDSGLPLDAKEFLQTRLYAWDDRLNFGIDNSANFGSITIHFFDWLSAMTAGTPYAGNYASVFFWLGLIFLSGFFLSYQLKNSLGKPFVFILPVLLVFNFYIFQSVFMLERAKFGIFSATIISLAVFFRMQDRKLSLVTSAIISSLAFSIFNGGNWFGITLYGGVVLILVILLFINFARGIVNGNFAVFKKTLLFIVLCSMFYLIFNAYSILPYLKNFLANDATRLVQDSSAENNKDWLRGVSQSASFVNLFRLQGIPEWYGDPDDFGKANPLHPYASFYLNNRVMVAISFIFPLLSFGSFLLVKTRKQKEIICTFGFITLLEAVFTAGSHPPLGFLYEFLMDRMPGFFLFRSAFYKFGIFYMLGTLVLLAFTVSFLIEKFSQLASSWRKFALLFIFTFMSLGLWFSYHWVLFDSTKIFTWKTDQSTKIRVPQYVFDFAQWAQENDLTDQRILLLPPVNKDWQNDAYTWGYWSLSPITYALSSVRVLSSWHGLTSEELGLLEGVYDAIRENDEVSFFERAHRLNIGYVLLRQDVLVDSSWSASEKPENYRNVIESFRGVNKVEKFREWDLYRLESAAHNQFYTITSVNLTPDNFVSLVNNFFNGEHTVGFSTTKEYPELESMGANKVDVYDCLSCLLEKQARLKSLPDVTILPNSLFFYFKTRQEQTVLNQSKDSRSKIGDYLGLILRRTAELQKMLDLSTREEYLMGNMEVIRLYLGQLYSEIESSQGNSYDFELLKQVTDFLNPVERELSDYARSRVSKTRSHRFGEEILGILWDIERIKELFTPLLEDPTRWSKEKVYKINFPESGKYTLFFFLQAFPRDIEGSIVLPEIAKFVRNGEEKRLGITNAKEEWLSVELGYQDKGDGKLTLYFGELPNLFSIESSGLEKLSSGKAACLSGSIKNFDRGRVYQVLVSKTDRLRSVQVIFRDKHRVYSEQHGFLKGEDLFEVPAVAKGEFSKYVYYPSIFAKDISLYVCSDDVVLPQVDKIIVQEFFTPSVLSIRESSIDVPPPPEVRYARLNPTEYEGEVKDSNFPFIIIFNERFNQSWKLFTKRNGSNWKAVDKHFMIDGYANGWLIEQEGTRKFKIEYVPQRMFYIGSAISLISLFLGIFWLVYSNILTRRKGQNEYKQKK